MKRTIPLMISVLLSCTVLSGCKATVKAAERATPVSTVYADTEYTYEEKTVDQMSDKALFVFLKLYLVVNGERR